MQETFPWLSDFWESCRSSVGTKNIKVLENLVMEYRVKVSGSVKDCYMKPNRAAKLKKCMNDVLVFFHLCYHDMQESMEHSSYLDRMTDLVSMYLDMEIKASRRRKESVKKIACRLSSCLYVLLDNSEEHILDAILKAKFINKHHRELCVPLLGKILNRSHTYNMYETLYVRYLLAFKLWKKVAPNADERRRINKMAVAKLIPPPHFVEKSKLFNTVLPKVPKSKKNITMFFMQAKFNLKSACTAFLKTCKESQQPGFSPALSLSIDKPLFYADGRSNSPTGLDEKDLGGGSGNLINDIWSSICNVDSSLENNAQLKDLEVEKESTLQVVRKKKLKEKPVKKKVKKKKDVKKSIAEHCAEKSKKKKMKKKIMAGFGSILLGSSASSNVSLLKKLRKGNKVKKMKKKKSQDNSNVNPESTSEVKVNNIIDILEVEKGNKQLTVKESFEVKVENSGIKEIGSEKKEDCESAVISGKGSGVVRTCEILSDKQNSLPIIKDVNRVQITEPLNQVDLVNSASSNDSSILSMPKDKNQKTSSKSENTSVNQVHIVNSVGSEEALESQRRVIVKVVDMGDVIQPSSSSSPTMDVTASSQLTDISVGSSQLGPVTTENEAIATKNTDISNTDVVLPKVVRDPVLVSSQSTNSQEPDTISYACDSSVKNEVPLTGDVCTPVANHYSEVPMDIDADDQMLSDLRSRGAVKCDGEEDEVVLADEFIRRDNIDNIFNTGNEALVIELLGDLPEHQMNLTSSPRAGHDSSDAETLDPFETLYLSNMMNSFFTAKDDFSREKQESLLRGVSSAKRAEYVKVQTQEPSKNIMEGDGGSTDEETENDYDGQNTRPQNNDSNKKQQPIGGKVIPTAVISSTGCANIAVKEKESVPSPPVSNAVNNVHLSLASNNSCSESKSSSEKDNIKEVPSQPHIAVNTSALSSASSLASGELQEQPVNICVPVVTVESRTENCTERPEFTKVRENKAVPEIIENNVVPEIREGNAVPEIREDSAVPEIRKDSAVPEIRKDSAVPKIRKDNAVPRIRKDSAVPRIRKDSAVTEMRRVSAVAEMRRVSAVTEIRKDSAVPEIRKDSAVPEIRKDSVVPQIREDSAVHEISKDNAVPEIKEGNAQTVDTSSTEKVLPKSREGNDGCKSQCVEDSVYNNVTVSQYSEEVPECLPSVESDSHKVSELPVKELPKPSTRGRRGRPSSKPSTVNRITRYCLKSPDRNIKQDEGPPPPKNKRQSRTVENNSRTPVKKQKKGKNNLNARPLTRSVSKLCGPINKATDN